MARIGDFEVVSVQRETVWILPDEIACQLGHIASRWACIERLIRLCIYMMVPVEEPAGRLVIGTARQSEQLTKLQDLLTVRNLSVQTNISDIQKSVDTLEKVRDKYIHANWLRDKTTKVVYRLDITGKWNLGKDAPVLKKRALPSAEVVNEQLLKDVVKQLDAVVSSLNLLHADLLANALPPLAKAVHAQALLHTGSQDQTGSTPSVPPPKD